MFTHAIFSVCTFSVPLNMCLRKPIKQLVVRCSHCHRVQVRTGNVRSLPIETKGQVTRVGRGILESLALTVETIATANVAPDIWTEVLPGRSDQTGVRYRPVDLTILCQADCGFCDGSGGTHVAGHALCCTVVHIEHGGHTVDQQLFP